MAKFEVFSGSDPPNGYISSSYDHWGGNHSKKNINKFYPLEKFWVFLFVTPPDLVQISWNDPYMYIIENKNTFSVWLAQC